MKKLLNFLRYYIYFDYYLELFAKNLSGRGLMLPDKNGEFNVMKAIILNKKKNICYIDGGSNIGDHIIKFNSICKKYKILKYSIFGVEPHLPSIKRLKTRLKKINYKLINKSLGDKKGKVNFFIEKKNDISGRNSVFKHFYLDKFVKIEQTTIDNIVRE